MIKFRSKKEQREFNSPKFCPVLFRKISVIAGVAEREYAIDFFITSTSRKDGSSHDPRKSNGRIRAVDIRVRDPYTCKRIITIKQVRELKRYHHTRFQKYGRFDSLFEHNISVSIRCKFCNGIGKIKNKRCGACEGTGKQKRFRGPHIHSQTPSNLKITI